MPLERHHDRLDVEVEKRHVRLQLGALPQVGRPQLRESHEVDAAQLEPGPAQPLAELLAQSLDRSHLSGVRETGRRDDEPERRRPEPGLPARPARHHASSPMAWTSGSSSMPKRAATSARARSISASTSVARAPGPVTRKLA